MLKFLIFCQTLIGLITAYREYLPSELTVPPVGYYISDPDGFLSRSEFEASNMELKTFTKLQVGVLLIDKMSSSFTNQYYNQDTAAQDFAKKVFDNWGIGDRQTNNGLLIFISVKDRKFRIVTGAGAREIVSDSSADEIFEDVKYNLKNSDYSNAIKESIEGVKYYENPSFFKKIYKAIAAIISALIIPLCFLGFICCVASLNELRPENRNRRDFTSKIQKLQKLQKEGKLTDSFISSNCGICLEDFSTAERANPKSANFIILVCGHNFHKDCLEAWLQKKNICPFCKLKDPTNSNRDPFRNNEYEKLNEEEDRRSPNIDNSLDMLFRMVMIQRYRYPQFHNDYSFSYGNNGFSYRDVRPPPQTSYSSSSGGSHGSYGGGHSSGGGGGGGSW